MILVAQLFVHVLGLMILPISTFLIELVYVSSIIDSLRLCTVHIGPPQDKGSAVHYSKHTEAATSAFSNC